MLRVFLRRELYRPVFLRVAIPATTGFWNPGNLLQMPCIGLHWRVPRPFLLAMPGGDPVGRQLRQNVRLVLQVPFH